MPDSGYKKFKETDVKCTFVFNKFRTFWCNMLLRLQKFNLSQTIPQTFAVKKVLNLLIVSYENRWYLVFFYTFASLNNIEEIHVIFQSKLDTGYFLIFNQKKQFWWFLGVWENNLKVWEKNVHHSS